MCFVACVVGECDKNFVDTILQLQAHRGPDELGMFSDHRVTMLHKRLAIVDLAKGKQPMANEDGTLWITYNGEIYNFVELREQLMKEGHVFRSNCDTEVLLHAFEEWGEDFLSKLNGMFSLIIYDINEPAVFVARDRFGIKPLHYASIKERFVFASEGKGIWAHDGLEHRMQDNSLDFYYNNGTQTRFTDIGQLAPGTLGKVVWEKSGQFSFESRVFYSTDQFVGFHDFKQHDELNLVNRLYELLDASVKRRLMGDVPFGVFISGGIDSGFITSLATKYTKDITGFTVGIRGVRQYNEYWKAEALAQSAGIPLVYVELTVSDIIRAIPVVIHHLEDYDPRNVEIGILNYFLAKKAKEVGVKVVLTGEGSDELFCGYRNFYPKHFDKEYTPSNLQKLRIKLLNGLGGNHLLHKDRVCMAHAVEQRVPFLDHELVQFALGVNPLWFVRGGLTYDRYLLREAAKKEVFSGRMPESTQTVSKGYIHLEIGVPRIICEYLNIEVRRSLKARYHFYETIFKNIFLQQRDFNEIADELLCSQDWKLKERITTISYKKLCDSGVSFQ